MDTSEIVGLTLWWAEGTKIRPDKRWNGKFNYSVEITNTDPEIIVTFLNYLREKLGVQNNRIKIQLQIHESDNQDELECFWEQVSKVPRKQFNKTIIRPVGNKVGKTKGTCKIRVHDKALFLRLTEKLVGLRGVVHR